MYCFSVSFIIKICILLLSKCINVLICKLKMVWMLIIILINAGIETVCLALLNLLHIHLSLSTKETISESRWVTTYVVFYHYNLTIINHQSNYGNHKS